MEFNSSRFFELVRYKLTSPTFLWFLSLYISVLLSMIMFNISREGFNADGIFGGPSYYANLFLHYGLNANANYESPWASGFRAWLIAPFLAIWLGLPLYFLKDAGYAYNGETRSDPQGNFFFAFFDENVYGFEINIFGEKGNLFYIGIIWIPILVATFTTIYYKRRMNRETSIVNRFLISFIIAIWLGISMAKMTDPSLSFSLQGFFQSLFDNRRHNAFVEYDGHYHPLMLATLTALFQIINLIIFGLLDSVEVLIGKINSQREHYRIQREVKLKRQSAGMAKLPWEADSSDKSKKG